MTKASRRLTGAVERKADVDVLTVLMVELEKVFDDFCVIVEEYETLVSEEEHADHQVVNMITSQRFKCVPQILRLLSIHIFKLLFKLIAYSFPSICRQAGMLPKIVKNATSLM